MIDHPPQLLKEMTSSAAFRCVQAWLLEKPAAWADDPCLAAAQMAQRPPNKRPREDALLEAERSHQRRRIEILDAERSHKRSLIEHLEVRQAEVKRLEERLRDLAQVKNEVDYVSEEAVYGQATRAQRAELALRWFEANAAWDVEWILWDVGGSPSPPPRPDDEELISEWQAELSETL